MAGYIIRKYKDSDYEAVRSMFADGMLEHAPATRGFLLKRPQIHIFLLGVFLFFFAIVKSYLLAITALFISVVAGRLHLDSEFRGYVQQCYKEDLLDIQKSYMEREGACFWVAESDGEIVGMVAAQPPQIPDGEHTLELRRMSVGKNCRGQGIGKALCRAVIGFAQEHGCTAVILDTSVVQYAAHKLYESVGFQKVNNHMYPSFFGKVTNFGILRFRYDIPSLT
ncbi:probable N-acetyltransferase camello [Pleurodeles waltl]|uniref:probable N-acetyltransferase camello n=1 Tax=Pleurodeles waltl TaxID=8319 RepID=UPI0037099B08